MSSFSLDFLQRLGLGIDANERDVKRAYARMLKQIDQGVEPERFEQLRRDYEAALEHARNPPDSQGFLVEFDFVEGNSQAQTQTPSSPPPGDTQPPSPFIESISGGELSQPMDLNTDFSSIARAPRPDRRVELVERRKTPRMESAFDEAQRELRQFKAEAMLQSASHPEALVALLRHYIKRDTMLSLAVHEAFEIALIQTLAARGFEQHSGAMLLAANTVYGWKSGDSKRLTQCGSDGMRLSDLLDEEDLISPEQLKRWLLLAGRPQAQQARSLLDESHTFKEKSPALFRFFYSDEHLKRWIFAPQTESFWGRVRDSVWEAPRKFFRNRRLLKIMWMPLLLMALFGVFKAVVGVPGSSPQSTGSSLSAGCDASIAQAVQLGWRDVPVGLAFQLKGDCERFHPPAMCRDRAALSELVSLAQTLRLEDWLKNREGLKLRTTAGLSYKVEGPQQCELALRLATSSNWLGVGDKGAAELLFLTLGACYGTASDVGTPAEANVIKYLKHVDAWPMGAGRAQEGVIPLQSLLGKADEKPVGTEVSQYQKSWPACASTAEDLLTASKYPSTGDAERKAVFQRALRDIGSTTTQ